MAKTPTVPLSYQGLIDAENFRRLAGKDGRLSAKEIGQSGVPPPPKGYSYTFQAHKPDAPLELKKDSSLGKKLGKAAMIVGGTAAAIASGGTLAPILIGAATGAGTGAMDNGWKGAALGGLTGAAGGAIGGGLIASKAGQVAAQSGVGAVSGAAQGGGWKGAALGAGMGAASGALTSGGTSGTGSAGSVNGWDLAPLAQGVTSDMGRQSLAQATRSGLLDPGTIGAVAGEFAPGATGDILRTAGGAVSAARSSNSGTQGGGMAATAPKRDYSWVIPALSATGGAIGAGLNSRAANRATAANQQTSADQLALERELAYLRARMDESDKDPYRSLMAQVNNASSLDELARSRTTPARLSFGANAPTFGGRGIGAYMPNISGGYEYDKSAELRNAAATARGSVLGGSGRNPLVAGGQDADALNLLLGGGGGGGPQSGTMPFGGGSRAQSPTFGGAAVDPSGFGAASALPSRDRRDELKYSRDAAGFNTGDYGGDVKARTSMKNTWTKGVQQFDTTPESFTPEELAQFMQSDFVKEFFPQAELVPGGAGDKVNFKGQLSDYESGTPVSEVDVIGGAAPGQGMLSWQDIANDGGGAAPSQMAGGPGNVDDILSTLLGGDQQALLGGEGDVTDDPLRQRRRRRRGSRGQLGMVGGASAGIGGSDTSLSFM